MSENSEDLKDKRYIEPGCTGHYWHDEYGNEAFVHDEYTYCPVHDGKSK